MRELLAIPDRHKASAERRAATSEWEGKPTEVVAKAILTLGFKPTTMEVWVERQLHGVAGVLGLDVPWKGESGQLDCGGGAMFQYTWGTLDGRSTDWLKLSAPYNAEAMMVLLGRIQAAVQVKDREDLQVYVWAPCSD